MTPDDVALAIKLSLRQIKAVEADDWQSLPCNTIVRGFVRNYARLLGLNPEHLMSALDQLDIPKEHELDIPTGPTVNLQKDGKADRRDYFRVFAGLVFLLLALAAYFLVSQDRWQSALSSLKLATQFTTDSGPSANTPLTGGNKAAEEQQAPTAASVPPPVAAGGTPMQPVSAPEPVPAPMPSLNFSFAQPSWVEVRDRSGEVIFSQLCQARTQREITGQPPFALVIGNASQVTLLYKGKEVDLSVRSKDDVARLTLE